MKSLLSKLKGSIKNFLAPVLVAGSVLFGSYQVREARAQDGPSPWHLYQMAEFSRWAANNIATDPQNAQLFNAFGTALTIEALRKEEQYHRRLEEMLRNYQYNQERWQLRSRQYPSARFYVSNWRDNDGDGHTIEKELYGYKKTVFDDNDYLVLSLVTHHMRGSRGSIILVSPENKIIKKDVFSIIYENYIYSRYWNASGVRSLLEKYKPGNYYASFYVDGDLVGVRGFRLQWAPRKSFIRFARDIKGDLNHNGIVDLDEFEGVDSVNFPRFGEMFILAGYTSGNKSNETLKLDIVSPQGDKVCSELFKSNNFAPSAFWMGCYPREDGWHKAILYINGRKIAEKHFNVYSAKRDALNTSARWIDEFGKGRTYLGEFKELGKTYFRGDDPFMILVGPAVKENENFVLYIKVKDKRTGELINVSKNNIVLSYGVVRTFNKDKSARDFVQTLEKIAKKHHPDEDFSWMEHGKVNLEIILERWGGSEDDGREREVVTIDFGDEDIVSKVENNNFYFVPDE